MRQGTRLAFDVGKARIGVARCDAAAILAVPVTTIYRSGTVSGLEEAAELVAEFEPMEVIVGLPRTMSGGESSSTVDALDWARGLRKRIGDIPIRMVDERLTTVSAHQALHSSGRSAKNFRSVVDQAAAVVILEHALEMERHTGQPAGDSLTAQKGAS